MNPFDEIDKLLSQSSKKALEKILSNIRVFSREDFCVDKIEETLKSLKKTDRKFIEFMRDEDLEKNSLIDIDENQGNWLTSYYIDIDLDGEGEYGSFMNSLRIILLRFNGKIMSKEDKDDFFIEDSVIENNYKAIYSQYHSNVNKGKKRVGTIFIDMSEMTLDNIDFSLFTDTLLHEIRHYYDHLIGILFPKNKNFIVPAINVPAIMYDLDTQDLSKEGVDLDKVSKEDKISMYSATGKYIDTFCYLFTPSEINAYLESFSIFIKKIALENKESISSVKDIELLLENEDLLGEFCIELYRFRYLFANFEIYKNFMEIALEGIPKRYYYFFTNSLIDLIFTDKACNKLSELFTLAYYDNDLKDEEKFYEGFKKFIDEKWIPLTFKFYGKIMKKVYGEMDKIIEKTYSELNI